MKCWETRKGKRKTGLICSSTHISHSDLNWTNSKVSKHVSVVSSVFSGWHGLNIIPYAVVCSCQSLTPEPAVLKATTTFRTFSDTAKATKAPQMRILPMLVVAWQPLVSWSHTRSGLQGSAEEEDRD